MPLICRIPAARREPRMLQVLRTVQNHDRRIGSSVFLYQYVMYSTVSGINPPMSSPSKQRQAKYPALLVRPACAADTKDQAVMMKGIHLSGPIFLEIKPDGNSAARKESRKIVCPVLKSFVSMPSSVKRSSEIAAFVSKSARQRV
jgi:hypothetical protein